MITPNLHPQSQINILKGADSNQFWQVFRAGVIELEKEEQKLVNDMRRGGDIHEADRLRRAFYELLANGEITNQIINRLESKITQEKPDPQPQ